MSTHKIKKSYRRKITQGKTEFKQKKPVFFITSRFQMFPIDSKLYYDGYLETCNVEILTAYTFFVKYATEMLFFNEIIIVIIFKLK